MNIPLFKIRASACGQIMTNDRSGKSMGKTAMSYCEMWLKEQIYNRKKEVTTKYMEKGLIIEDNSLDFIAEQLGHPMLIKNTRYEENDFMTGCPDVVLLEDIYDAKNSWSWETFPIFETEIPNKDYEYQLQVYMKLFDKPKAKLIYVLSDTPENLIEREAFFYCRNNGMELEAEIYEQFKDKMTYPDIANKYKIKVFNVARNDETIKAIEARVVQCREYINELMKGL